MKRKLLVLVSLALIVGCGNGVDEQAEGPIDIPSAITADTGQKVLDPRVDLSPVEPFCLRADDGLIVNVSNIGNEQTAAFVIVRFSYSNDIQTATTNVIPANQQAQVIVGIPQPVPAGDYDIVIDVERAGTNKTESNTGNNQAEAHCIG